MDKYKCEICGKKHTIYRSLEIPLPRIISEIPVEEREERLKEFGGFYYVDDELLFANGWVNIEVENHDFPFFFWKTWTSISKNQFLENLDNLKTGKVIEFDGKLEEELPYYLNSKDLGTKTLIQARGKEIIVEIQIQEESQLKEDQLKPISENRMIEIMQMLYHHPKRKERKKFKKPFEERLLVELNNVEQECIRNNKEFAINISGDTVLFQVISNKILEINRHEERGFGLHLSFDESFGETEEEIVKFRSKAYSKEFDYHDLDKIPTYQIDLGTDKKRLVELVRKIVIDVYEENLKTIDTDFFEI